MNLHFVESAENSCEELRLLAGTTSFRDQGGGGGELTYSCSTLQRRLLNSSPLKPAGPLNFIGKR